MNYNEVVRRHFAEPLHAGGLPGDPERTLEAVVAESGEGACVALAAGIDGEVVTAMAYRVRGCPHLIAALELACAALEHGPVGRLEKFDLVNIKKELSLPTEKSGRILMLEDAVARLWAQYAATTERG